MMYVLNISSFSGNKFLALRHSSLSRTSWSTDYNSSTRTETEYRQSAAELRREGFRYLSPLSKLEVPGVECWSDLMWHIRGVTPAFQHKNRIPHSHVHESSFQFMYYCRYRWPRCLRHGSAAAHLLGLWLRIPPGAWRSVSCDCCVLWGRGFYIGWSLVQRSTTECDRVAVKGGHDRASGRSAPPPKKKPLCS
jgi:hypothetical protein